jgi:hypothetical protein
VTPGVNILASPCVGTIPAFAACDLEVKHRDPVSHSEIRNQRLQGKLRRVQATQAAMLRSVRVSYRAEEKLAWFKQHCLKCKDRISL